MLIDKLVKPSYKSVEGGSAITVLLSAIVAVYVIITGDQNTLSPENVELIIKAGLEKAQNANDIAEIYKMMNVPPDYSKILEILAVLAPSGGFLGFFTKKRSDVKIAAIQTTPTKTE